MIDLSKQDPLRYLDDGSIEAAYEAACEAAAALGAQ